MSSEVGLKIAGSCAVAIFAVDLTLKMGRVLGEVVVVAVRERKSLSNSIFNCGSLTILPPAVSLSDNLPSESCDFRPALSSNRTSLK
jgi:hypothetical protein